MTESSLQETVELEISDVAYRGKGVARHEGRVVFVPGVLTGEVVKARFVRHSKNFSEARLVQILRASQYRVEPECPLAARGKPLARALSGEPSTCPGCCYQHMAYEEEVRLKQKQLANHLTRLGKCDALVCLPPVPSPVSSGYRNSITLHAALPAPSRWSGGQAGRSKGGVVLGYFAEDNTTVLDVERCPLAMKPLNDKLAEIRRHAGFMSGLETGSSVMLRYTEADGAQCWVCRALSTERRTDGAQEPEWHAFVDGSMLTEQTPLGPVSVPRGSFFQVNPKAADLLIPAVSGLVREISSRVVIDMYCGVGVFALASAAAGAKEVAGVDSDVLAIRAAKRNSVALGFPNVRFAACAADEGLRREMVKRSAADVTLIVDPPRRGLEKEVVETICATQPSDIIYISCAADTMARDIAALTAGGYGLKRAQLLDMFPRTACFETTAWLSL